MIKSGSTAWQIIKPGVDLGLIDSIIITYKTLPGYGSRVLLQKRYPDDTRVNGDELLLPLSQADTTLLREEGGDRVRLELQYNYSSGAVAKSEIQTVHIGDTLATAFVDGSNPDEAQIEGLPIEFTTGDAIVIESKNKCVKDWNENNPESEKYIEGRSHYKVCVFHSETNKPNTHDGWHQIDKPGEGVSLLIDGTDVPDYWWPRYTELSNVIAESHGTFEAEIKLGFPEDSAYADRTMEYKIEPGNLKNAKYLTMLDDKNYTVNFIGTNTPYRLQIAIIVDTAALVEENKAVYPVRGIYFVCEGTDALPSGSHVTMVRTGIFRYYPLDPKYIPDEIARTADVVSRQQLAADAGKALVIGEDGVVVPAEVETAQPDFSAGEGEPGHILNRTHYRATVPEYVCFEGQVNGNDSVTLPLEYEVPAGAMVEQYMDGGLICTLAAADDGDYVYAGDGRISTRFYNSEKLLKVENYAWNSLVKIVVRNLEVLKPLDEEFIPSTIARKNYVDEAVAGAGAGGNLIVTITENDDGTLTPSHTSQEIYEAYMGGKSVTAVLDSYIFHLTGSLEDTALFAMTAVGEHNNVSQGQIIVAGNKAAFEDHHILPMTPASADEDGASGLVPAPAAGQQDMVLHGDGTWRVVEGGGSGGGGEWRLLNDITTTEEITGATGIRISAADDGTPYNLKEVIFAWRCPAAAGASYATFRVNGKQVNGLSTYYFGSGNFISTGEQKAVCSIKAAGDAAVLSGTAGINNYGVGGTPINVIYNYPNVFETITSIDFTFFGDLAIPTGLSLKIWGLEV